MASNVIMGGSAFNHRAEGNGNNNPSQSDAPMDTLCSNCQQLNLSVQKFVPGTAADSTLPGFLATSVDFAGLQRLDLGYVDDIYRRRDRCSFCWLIFQGTHTLQDTTPPTGDHLGLDGLTKEGKRVRCHIDWQLDGRLVGNSNLDQKSRPPTRRMRVFSPENYWTDTHIMLMSSEVPSLAQPSFLARKASSSTVDPKILKKWLRICKESHNCASDESMTFTDRLRFIDLEQEALVSFSEGKTRITEYATLSYAWGGPQPFMLSTSKYNSLMAPGALGPRTSGLSRTIRDAMLLVKAIGLRYLWIDAICIIQDSVEDKSTIIPLMDKIFQNGTFNICAASGSSSREGIRGSIGTPRASNGTPVVKCAGLHLMAAKTIESRIQHTAWNERAWIFQERMLSRRSIIFVENCTFFQCSQATWSEEVCSESSLLTWTLEMVRSPFESVSKNPVRLYLQYVESFTAKQLTFSGDRLNAFQGILSMLEPLLGTPFLYGLPAAYFDLALLWESRAEERRDADCLFPSWSWCGWAGSCAWRISMISGILLDLHEWLLSHTWVVWWHLSTRYDSGWRADGFAPYVADEFQLVWSSSQCIPGTVTPRWQGYVPSDGTYYGRHLRTADNESSTVMHSDSRPVYPTSTVRKVTCLYFWTYTAFFQLSRQSRTDPTFASKLETGLHRFSLMDSNGDWCGTIVLKESFFSSVGDILEFAAISDARDFSMEELDTWNYYVPEDREVSEWQLYYALFIVWNREHTVAERVGLAKIYKRAYDVASFDPGKAWREIILE